MALEGKKLQMDEAKLNIETQHKSAELSMTHDHEMKKLDIEKEKMERVEKDKQSVKDETEVKSFAPQVLETMKKMIDSQNQMIDSQNKFNEKLIEQISKPKTVTLGNIKRGPDGITGASATTH